MKALPLLRCSIVLLVGSGCTASEAEIANGEDPLRALESEQLSGRYTSSFWGEQMSENPELWARATAYCDQHQGREHPNCAAVRYARTLEVNSRPPEYESNTSLRPGAPRPTPDASQ